jgi:hypothetical protein
LANLRLRQPKTKSDEQAALFDSGRHYLQSRLPMLDYAHFRRRGYPIGRLDAPSRRPDGRVSCPIR